jgi:KUP system potassium uptake protein
VLLAINPWHGLSYLLAGGGTGFLVLGGVFLCVIGAEALYADMGHFGAGPIRLAWSAVVFPSHLLNYAGQAALVLAGAPSSDNIFYRLCPSFLLLPLVVLATIATIIASQSIITGTFSMYAPGDTTRLAATAAHYADLSRRLRTDLCGLGQLTADAGHAGAYGWFR